MNYPPVYHALSHAEVARTLRAGGIGVAPTDTLYGIIGLALSKRSVERMYRVRERDRGKPFIVLIARVDDLKLFGIVPTAFQKKVCSTLWPGKISMAMPCASKKFFYLHRGTKSIACRIPRHKGMLKLLTQTGPLVAPSANPQGKNPALTIADAQRYFGSRVDFYVDAGRKRSKPSTLMVLEKHSARVIRSGAVALSDELCKNFKIIK